MVDKYLKRIVSVLLALTMIVMPIGYTQTKAYADESGTVVLSIEKFTIGQGFLIEPVEVEYSGDTTIRDIVTSVLENNGMTYTSIAGPGSFYLASIKNADNGKLEIPYAITQMEPCNQSWIAPDVFAYPPSTDVNDGNDDFPALGEFAYSSTSGWVYSVNGQLDDGASAYKIKDGDVIRFQFSVYGFGADLGLGLGEPKNLELPDKEELIAVIAKANKSAYKANDTLAAVYNEALLTAVSYEVTEEEIADVTKRLREKMSELEPPEETTSPEIQTTKENVTTKEEITTKETPEITTMPKTTESLLNRGKIASVKNVKGKKAKITIKKVKNAKGYQIKYATSKKFKGPKIKSTKKLTYTLKKLTKGKTYYIKVRAYRLVKKEKRYGQWSKTKKVKIVK